MTPDLLEKIKSQRSLNQKLRLLLEQSDILSHDPERAIFGTHVENEIRKKMGDAHFEACFEGYSPISFRFEISQLSKDLTSPVAKVSNRNGYYKRSASPADTLDTTTEKSGKNAGKKTGKKNRQPEEVFRAFFIRYVEQNGIDRDYTFPNLHRQAVKIHHQTAGRKNGDEAKKSGIMKWMFPDVVVLDWQKRYLREEAGKEVLIDSTKMDVISRFGESPLQIRSVELKHIVDSSNLKEAFFQCVSNSKWANIASLVVACDANDDEVENELKRLGLAYGVEVVMFGLTPQAFDQMGTPDDIYNLSPEKFSLLCSTLGFDGELTTKVRVLSPEKPNREVDWGYSDSADVPQLSHIVPWIGLCMKDARIYSYDGFIAQMKRNQREFEV